MIAKSIDAPADRRGGSGLTVPGQSRPVARTVYDQDLAAELAVLAERAKLRHFAAILRTLAAETPPEEEAISIEHS